MTKQSKQIYYKVLIDGESFHGGDFKWSLPTQCKTAIGELENGLPLLKI